MKNEHVNDSGLLRKLGTLGLVVAVVLIVPRASSAIASWLAPHLFGDLSSPVYVWLWSSAHHTAQLLLALGLMLALHRPLSDWGFNLRQWRLSLRLFGKFVLYFTLFVGLGHVPLILFGQPPAFVLTPEAVMAELTFKGLLSGTSEEPLFRGFVMTVLYTAWRGKVRIGPVEVPHAGLWATGLFMLAHVGFTLSPLAITHFSPIQQVQAAIMGVFYAVYFHQTRSLLAPILVHNYFNFMLTALGMTWALLAR